MHDMYCAIVTRLDSILSGVTLSVSKCWLVPMVYICEILYSLVILGKPFACHSILISSKSLQLENISSKGEGIFLSEKEGNHGSELNLSKQKIQGKEVDYKLPPEEGCGSSNHRN